MYFLRSVLNFSSRIAIALFLHPQKNKLFFEIKDKPLLEHDLKEITIPELRDAIATANAGESN